MQRWYPPRGVRRPSLIAQGPLKLDPLKRATLRIKLHIPLIKLIKKDQVCYSAAPSTTNQNATQGNYIKDKCG